MANGTPFTAGKNSARDNGAKPGGYFKEGTGGHTSRGVHEPAHGAVKSGHSTSNKTTRIGNLKLRTHGAGGKIDGI